METIKESKDIFRRLNSPDFNPAETALIEIELAGIEAPDSSSVVVTDYSLHRINMDVRTDKNSFLVLSEIYYPAGWNAYLDGKKIDIYATDHTLRGMVIPAGEHRVEVIFEPFLHRLSSILSLIGIVVTMLLGIAGGWLYYKKNYCGGIDYVMKD